MKQCVEEKDSPIVKCLKSGKWAAKVNHPICKVWVLVGVYTTRQEAEDACARKKLDYQSGSSQETYASYNADVSVYDNHIGISHKKSGKWVAQISQNNDAVWLGTYNSPKEAAYSYIMSRLELDSQKSGSSNKVDELSSQKDVINITKVTVVTAGDGQVSIDQKKMEINWIADTEQDGVYLRTFDSAEETYSSKKRKQSNHSCQGDATVCELDEPTVEETDTTKEAADSDNVSKLETDSQNIDCEQRGRTRRAQGTGSVNKTKSGKWRAVLRKRKAKHYVGTYATREDAEAAISLKKRDLVLKAEKAKEDYRNKKHKQENDSCEEYAVMDGKSGSTCESDDPLVSIHGSSVFNADGEEGSMPNVNDESIGEFDIVNCYGQLVGEYSRMDDDLWIC